MRGPGAGVCSSTSVRETSEPQAFWWACSLVRKDAEQREHLLAVANAFTQNPFALKVGMASFTGHYGLAGFTTRWIKKWLDDGSHEAGSNRFTLLVYLYLPSRVGVYPGDHPVIFIDVLD